MSNSSVKIASLLILSGYLLLACAQVKETGRTIGHTTRDAATAIGHGTRDAAKAVGEGLKKVVKSALRRIVAACHCLVAYCPCVRLQDSTEASLKPIRSVQSHVDYRT